MLLEDDNREVMNKYVGISMHSILIFTFYRMPKIGEKTHSNYLRPRKRHFTART